MQFDTFGTLSLASRHRSKCPDPLGCRPSKPARYNCYYVPGVQKTEYFVQRFLQQRPNSVVVEEHGSIRGRKHFHILQRDSDSQEALWRTYEAWKSYGIAEVEPIKRNVGKAIAYVLKYFWKSQKETEYESTDIGESRIWFGEFARKTESESSTPRVRYENGYGCGGRCHADMGRRDFSRTNNEPFRVRITRHRRAAIAAPNDHESDFFAKTHDQWNPERHACRFERAWEVPTESVWTSR